MDPDGEPGQTARQPSDALLIERSLADAELFGVLFDRYHPVISRYLFQRVGESAQDLAARTFMEAFEHRDRFDRSRGDARPWLFGIATNLLRHHLRDERRRLISLAGMSPPQEGQDIAEEVVIRDDLSRAAWALTSLDPGDRDALLLFAWAELTYPDIGLALGIPAGTVKSRINRARRKIRERLGDLGAS